MQVNVVFCFSAVISEVISGLLVNKFSCHLHCHWYKYGDDTCHVSYSYSPLWQDSINAVKNFGCVCVNPCLTRRTKWRQNRDRDVFLSLVVSVWEGHVGGWHDAKSRSDNLVAEICPPDSHSLLLCVNVCVRLSVFSHAKGQDKDIKKQKNIKWQRGGRAKSGGMFIDKCNEPIFVVFSFGDNH